MQSRGDLTDDEAAVMDIAAAADFLTMLEVTKMTRSFKMVTLLVFLQEGALPGTLPLDRLTAEFARVAGRHARLRADVGEDLADLASLRAYLMKNPVLAWCKPQGSRTYFEVVGDALRTTFSVPERLRASLASLAREIIDLRLATYLAGRGDSPDALRIVCKLMRNDRHAILKLPDRARFEGIPDQSTLVSVEGRTLRAMFVAQFVNVLEPAGGGGNHLGEVLARWFGPDAGMPGTSHFVAFVADGNTWTMQPLDPGEASRAVVE